VRSTAAAILLSGVAVTSLITDRLWVAGAFTVVLLALSLRAGRRAKPYLWGTLVSATLVFVFWPLLQTTGYHVLWSGPIVPVLGPLDVTSEELWGAGLTALRFAAVGLAFAVYALLLDHDRLLAAATARRSVLGPLDVTSEELWGAGLTALRFAAVGLAFAVYALLLDHDRLLAAATARRSVLGAALATRLVPTLERDARGLVEALRGRGIEPSGLRGHAALLSPLLAGSLERGLNLAEAMEARGFGRPGRTRMPQPRWRTRDFAAAALGVLLVIVGIAWL
jgi:energy-coupling factor transporter transmembrane protein EcfT